MKPDSKRINKASELSFRIAMVLVVAAIIPYALGFKLGFRTALLAGFALFAAGLCILIVSVVLWLIGWAIRNVRFE